MLIWVAARVLGVTKKKSFHGGRPLAMLTEQLRKAENVIVRDAQNSISDELVKVDRKGRAGGRFSSLTPLKNGDGFWVRGERLSNTNTIRSDATLQKLLLNNHPVTRLLMQQAHSSGHRGCDATLLFRQQYWVPQGSKLAQSVKSRCQKCKLREAKFHSQLMAPLPETCSRESRMV
jgi:hypothetical protein